MSKTRAGKAFVQDTTPLVNLRERWAQHANRALELAGHTQRIDHRTLEAQGLERVPQIHQGPKVAAMEQRGIRTDRGDHARTIERHNARLIDLQTQRRDLNLQLDAGEARDQFRDLWQQHQAEQAHQQQIQELADNAAEFRRHVDTQRKAEQTCKRELKRELEHELERQLERRHERGGPKLGR